MGLYSMRSSGRTRGTRIVLREHHTFGMQHAVMFEVVQRIRGTAAGPELFSARHRTGRAGDLGSGETVQRDHLSDARPHRVGCRATM